MTPRIFWVFFVGPEQLARFAVAFLRGTPDKSPDGSFTRSPIKNKRLLFLNQETPDENQVFFYNAPMYFEIFLTCNSICDIIQTIKSRNYTRHIWRDFFYSYFLVTIFRGLFLF